MTEVFGIPIISSKKFFESGKMNHVASVLAELLDNDNDGCADDPNILDQLLKKKTMDPTAPNGSEMRLSLLLMDDVANEAPDVKSEKLGYEVGQKRTY